MGDMFGAVVASQEQHSLCVMEPVRYSKNLQREEREKSALNYAITESQLPETC